MKTTAKLAEEIAADLDSMAEALRGCRVKRRKLAQAALEAAEKLEGER